MDWTSTAAGTRDEGRHRRRLRTVAVTLGLVAGVTAAGCSKPKGPYRPWVHKVYIDGTKQVKASDVRKKLVVQGSFFFGLAPRKYLEHPMAAEVDRERIVTYYQTRGYYSTKVPKFEITPYKTDDKKAKDDPEAVKAVDVRFTVEEGAPVRISKFTIDGLQDIGEDGVKAQAKLGIETGKILEHLDYLLAKEKFVHKLEQRGYAFAHLANAEVDVNRVDHTAEIVWVADPGPKVVLGDLTIEGTKEVDANALRKHAAMPKGEKYKPELLEDMQGKLYSLGLFSAVKVEPVRNPNNPKVADVKITVTEGRYRELRLGGGVGIESLRTEVHLEMKYTQRRFLGGLRTMVLTLRPGYAALPAVWANPIYRHGPMALAKAEFTQPDLLGPSSQLTLSFSYDLGIEYAYQYHGPSVRLGVSRNFWRDRIQLAASYNFQFLDFFNIDPSISDNASEAGSLYGFVDPYRLGYFQEQIVLDLRNRPVDARRGFYLALLSEQGGNYAGGAFSYQKLMPEMRGYIPIGERVTIAARLVFGQMFTQGDLGSPITQRFYLGGPNSHRGFTYNRLSYQVCSGVTKGSAAPIATKQDCDQNVENLVDQQLNRIPIGGDQMLLGQLELRVGILKLAGNWLSVVGFTDAGDVSAPRPAACQPGSGKTCDRVPYLDQVDITQLHVAVGGGLRYKTVIGTIRFDLGVRLNRLNECEGGVCRATDNKLVVNRVENPDPDQRIAYHISIGEAF